jgi:hypothetical protein
MIATPLEFARSAGLSMKFINLNVEYFRTQARLFRGRAAGARTAQGRAEFLAVAEAIEGFIDVVVHDGRIKIIGEADETSGESGV